MTEKIALRALALRIEWHWLFIKHGRKRGERLIDGLLARGLPINPPEVIELNRKLNLRNLKVMELMQRYESRSGSHYPPKDTHT